MNAAVKELLEQFQAAQAKQVELIELATTNKDSLLVKSLTVADRQVRWAVESGRKDTLERHLIDSLRHVVWGLYFNLIDFNKCVSTDVYWKAITAYQFANSEKRDYYNDVRELKDFTAENIEAFNAQFLKPSEELMQKAIKTLLYRTGDWRKYNKEYKARQTFKDVVSGTYEQSRIMTDRGNEIAEVLLALEYYQGKELTATRIGELRHEIGLPKPMDTETKVIDGVTVILKSSGSLELRLDKSVVALLNSKLPVEA